MGIESFSAVLNKHAPQSTFQLNLEEFRGEKIAVDMNWLMYLMMSPATKEILNQSNVADEKPDRSKIEKIALNKILERLTIFLYYGITPVCVFDGIPHSLKRDGNPKKKAQREIRRKKYEEARDKLYSAESLFRNQSLVDEFVKQYQQNIKVRHSFTEQVKDILSSVGFPVLHAEDFEMISNDAEALCATLCLKGNDYCKAAYTIDSDFHVYGGNIQIKEINYYDTTVDGTKTRIYYAEVRTLENILAQFSQSAGKEFTFDAFQDLCILLGNDFNTNIPNNGPVRCWNLITQHGSISNLPPQLDRSVLKYEQVKEMFRCTLCPIQPGSVTFDEAKFRENGRNVFELNNCISYFQTILDLLPIRTTRAIQIEICEEETLTDKMNVIHL